MVDTVKQDGEVSIAYMNASFYMATCHLKRIYADLAKDKIM